MFEQTLARTLQNLPAAAINRVVTAAVSQQNTNLPQSALKKEKVAVVKSATLI